MQTDLNDNTVARFNWITPDMFNDMHSNLSGGFEYHGKLLTGDSARIATGDNFLSIIIPQIMASQAYQDGGAIILVGTKPKKTAPPTTIPTTSRPPSPRSSFLPWPTAT